MREEVLLCFSLTMWNVNRFSRVKKGKKEMFFINYVECEFSKSLVSVASALSFSLTMWNVNIGL